MCNSRSIQTSAAAIALFLCSSCACDHGLPNCESDQSHQLNIDFTVRSATSDPLENVRVDSYRRRDFGNQGRSRELACTPEGGTTWRCSGRIMPPYGGECCPPGELEVTADGFEGQPVRWSDCNPRTPRVRDISLQPLPGQDAGSDDAGVGGDGGEPVDASPGDGGWSDGGPFDGGSTADAAPRDSGQGSDAAAGDASMDAT